jgi:hypothetical protein
VTLRIACLALAASLVAPSPGGAEAPSVSKVRLSGHVIPAVSNARRIASVEIDSYEKTLAITIVLKRDDQAGFDQHIRDLYDKSSPGYRRFLDQRAIADRFGPSRDSYARVLAYLRSQGLEMVEGSENRLTLTVRGRREDVEKAFDSPLGEYQLGEKRFFANADEPTLPAEIASSVQAVIGLSNFADVHVRLGPAGDDIEEAKDCYNAPRPPGVPPLPPYTEAQLKQLADASAKAQECWFKYVNLAARYNIACLLQSLFSLGGLVFKPCTGVPPFPPSDPPSATAVVGVTGAGQKVGLIQFDSFRRSDVADFLALVGAAPEQIDKLTEVKVNGGAPLGPDQAEVLLDVGVIMTLAPDAEVVVYSAPFAGRNVSFQGLFNRAINDGMDVISNSWTYCEDQTTLADVQSIDSILQNAAAAGISVFNASGDTGSTCLSGAPNTVGVPAGSPNATAVGGTSLLDAPGGAYAGETWWDGSASVPRTGQGGFGVSRFFERPSYQDGFTTSPMRSIPDVSVNADPVANGLPICRADDGGCPTPRVYGGTSVSAPTMAAFTALLNEAHGENLGFLNPQIYPLADTDAFHSAESMGSDFAHVGLGSPNVTELSLALRGETAGAASAEESRVLSTFPAAYADGEVRTRVLVQLRDATGATVSGKTVALAAEPALNVVIDPPSGVTTIDNGAVVFEVSNLTAETVVFTATDATDSIVLLEESEITFIVPPAAAGGITAFPTAVAADGSSSTTITVTLRDALDRPSPRKEITLSQGGGHAIISGPSPPVTDENGEIQFTATNRVDETITFTAIDVTDGELPVPGEAQVEFTGGVATCVNLAPPAAESGYAVTPFMTAFVAEDFFFGGINWGGCPGASYPAFVGESTFVANARTGGLYRVGSQGGAASSANLLATHGPTFGFPVADAEGHLYAVFGATSAIFPSGSVVEIDPDTGAILRTLASDQKCPTGLAIDPLSGDLFFAHQCFGGAASDPAVHRIRNPQSVTPVVEVYATLPTTPNGMLAFAPNGTLYAAVGYSTPTPSVVRVAGTDAPAPPTMTTLSDVPLFFTLTIGNVDADGEASSLIGPTIEGLEIFDITTSPAGRTVIAHDVGSGVIGPDGCLYASRSDTIYRVGRSDGACGFDPSGAVPLLTLEPAAVSPDPLQGSELTFTVTFRNVAVPEGTVVALDVSGANEKHQVALTNADGSASFGYSGTFDGDDAIFATARVGDEVLRSNTARVTWQSGPHSTFLTFNGSAKGGAVGIPSTVFASLLDLSVEPPAPIVGETVELTLDGDQCSAATDTDGVATCELAASSFGLRALVASFAGTSQYRPADTSTSFSVVGDALCGDFNGDGQVLSSDAFGILRTAIGLSSCELCVCDTDASGSVIVATDSLLTLRFAVGLPVTLTCPVCF